VESLISGKTNNVALVMASKEQQFHKHCTEQFQSRTQSQMEVNEMIRVAHMT
jgi:hypothetical protein